MNHRIPFARWVLTTLYDSIILDGYVKSSDAALRFILPRLSPGQACGVHRGTPHSSGFARLACGLFTKPPHFHDL